MYDVFISFNHKDKVICQNIADQLTQKYGITCWIYLQQTKGGDEFRDIIPKKIAESKIIVFVQSKTSLQSIEVKQELNLAHQKHKVIIPYILDDTTREGTFELILAGKVNIDATGGNEDDNIAELAKSIHQHLSISDTTNQETSKSLPSFQRKKDICENSLESHMEDCREIFVGRTDILENIKGAFEKRNVVFLCGMGGIGKSELARQYVRKYGSFYNTVVFARYESDIASLIADDTIFELNGIFRKNKEDGSLQSDEEYAREKLAVIKKISDTRTLIIVDNFDVFNDPLLELLTKNVPYHVLITTRCKPDQGIYFTIPVEELHEDDLKQMMIQYADPNITPIMEDDPAFSELFSITNRHTLTLELIAKYMSENSIDSICDIVDILKTEQLTGLSDTYDAIRRIFCLTKLKDAEKTFLRCLALMPGTGVRQSYFKQWCGKYFSEKVRLARLSLIQIQPSIISLHPVIREVIMEELQPGYENCKEFLASFSECISSFVAWNWDLAQKMETVNYADSILERLTVLDENTYPLYYAICILKNYTQEYGQVSTLINRVYEYICTQDGETSYRAGCVAFRAGWLCKKYLLMDLAKLWLEDRAYPALANHLDLAEKEYQHCCTNLCTLYIKKYELEQVDSYLDSADKYIKEAENIAQNCHDRALQQGDTEMKRIFHLRLAGVRMEQADLCMKRLEYLQAEQYLQDAEMILSEYPDNKADYTYLLSKFAILYMGQKQYDKALKTLLETRILCDSVFSKENDYILTVNIKLAECYECTGDTQSAYREWENVYDIAKEVFVDEHPLLQYIQQKMQVAREETT